MSCSILNVFRSLVAGTTFPDVRKKMHEEAERFVTAVSVRVTASMLTILKS